MDERAGRMASRRRGRKGVDRLIRSFKVLQKEGVVIMQLRILGLELEGGAEALQRFLVATLRLEGVPHLLQDLPAEDPGLLVFAVQNQSVVERVAGLFEPTETVQRLCLRHPCMVVVRVQLEALADQLEAFLVSSEVVESVALRVQRVIKVGLDLQAL